MYSSRIQCLVLFILAYRWVRLSLLCELLLPTDSVMQNKKLSTDQR